jgi:hypothetical protein
VGVLRGREGEFGGAGREGELDRGEEGGVGQGEGGGVGLGEGVG